MSCRVLSVIFGVFVFGLSLLAVFRAPTYALWLPALAVTEGGTYWAIGCVLWISFMKPLSGVDSAIRALVVLAALLFLTPLARAMSVAFSLPTSFETAFGKVTPRSRPGAPARLTPVSFIDLFRGIRSPAADKKTLVYSAVAGETLHMDIYGPSGAEPLPVVLSVHGGSWRSGDREELSGLNTYLAARGYRVLSIDYRLAPRSFFPAPRDDVFAAMDYLHKHAAEIGWDQKNLVLLGRSAGGQIALSAAYRSHDSAIKGVIAFYTPNDLIFGYENPGNPRILNSKALIGGYIGVSLNNQTRAQYEDASPLYAVGPATPPTLMIHGGRDELVWAIHDDRLGKKLQDFGRPYFYLRLPWATHGCDALLSGPSGQLSTYTVERFLAAVMPSVKGNPS